MSPIKFGLIMLLIVILWIVLSSMNMYDHGPPPGWVRPTVPVSSEVIVRTGQ